MQKCEIGSDFNTIFNNSFKLYSYHEYFFDKTTKFLFLWCKGLFFADILIKNGFLHTKTIQDINFCIQKSHFRDLIFDSVYD